MDLNPDWMSCLSEELWDVPLTHLAIPGSHDAMSYCLDMSSPLVPSESGSFRLLDRLLCCFTRPFIRRWATTQDSCIEDQLEMGIRFFDLRVAHKPNDPSCDMYFTHVIYTHLTVLETLSSVNSWLESHPREVVLLDCSHFEGIKDELHHTFIRSLKELFGSKLCPRGSSLTLRSLWESRHQVILCYDSPAADPHPELWPTIRYLWANQHTAQGVIYFLEWKKDEGRPEGFFVSGLNLTADRSYITKHPKLSLQTLTFSNWECLKTWLQEQKPGPDPSSLNIIAGDFVGPLPLCSLVIALNQKLLQKKAG